MSDETLVPDGMVCKRISLGDAAGRFDWWRVEDMSGALLGSGFDRQEAIENAWNELLRRESR